MNNINIKQRKELLRAILQGDKYTVERLTKGQNIWFKSKGIYYKGNLETMVSHEQFDSEFTPGSDTLIEFQDYSQSRQLLQEFGASPEEIAAQMAKNNSPEQTVNEILTLKNRLENE